MPRNVSDIHVHAENPDDPWVPSSELRRVVREAAADSELLDDLADVREAELDGAAIIRA
jgi:hypothetical protein